MCLYAHLPPPISEALQHTYISLWVSVHPISLTHSLTLPLALRTLSVEECIVRFFFLEGNHDIHRFSGLMILDISTHLKDCISGAPFNSLLTCMAMLESSASVQYCLF